VRLPPSRYGAPPVEVFQGVEGLVERVLARWQRPLVVTDAGVRSAGLLVCVDLDWPVWDGCRPDPTSDDVDLAATFARTVDPDVIVAVGGGSAMDTAKGIAFVLANSGRMEDWAGVGTAPRSLLPIIAVPTTAGTGSELQSFALIARASDHRKMACGHPSAMPKLVFHDPDLLASCPRSVAVEAGLDALVHALETAVTNVRTPESSQAALLAFSDLWAALPRFVEDPGHLESARRMQRGAAMAGAAIEASMLGAAHATANPLSARFGLPHGRAVACMAPAVIRLNQDDPGYRGLCFAAGVGDALALADAVELLCAKLGVQRAGAVAGDPAVIPELVKLASDQWTGRFNPVPLNPGRLTDLYRASW
jgi:alcohol dehydrogenase